jgi:hypothetical protein
MINNKIMIQIKRNLRSKNKKNQMIKNQKSIKSKRNLERNKKKFNKDKLNQK